MFAKYKADIVYVLVLTGYAACGGWLVKTLSPWFKRVIHDDLLQLGMHVVLVFSVMAGSLCVWSVWRFFSLLATKMYGFHIEKMVYFNLLYTFFVVLAVQTNDWVYAASAAPFLLAYAFLVRQSVRQQDAATKP